CRVADAQGGQIHLLAHQFLKGLFHRGSDNLKFVLGDNQFATELIEANTVAGIFNTDPFVGQVLVEQELRRALIDNAAVIHNDQVVAKELCLIHVMGGEHNGFALGFDVLDQLPKTSSRLGIESGGGLVEEDDFGIVDERQRQ